MAMDSKYPDAAEIPQVKMDQMQKPEGANPIVQAFETIAMYVKSLEDRQDPKAGPVKSHLTAMMQAITGSDTGEMDARAEAPTPEVSAPPPEGEKEEAPEDAAEGKAEGEQMPMMDKGAAKIGFDPFKDPAEEEKMMAMKKKKSNVNSSIQPLA